MSLSEPQQQILKNWMHSKAILQCPACGDTQWQYAQSAYIRALLEQDETDLAEDSGVVKISCGNCGNIILFDAEILGIRGLWAENGLSAKVAYLKGANRGGSHDGQGEAECLGRKDP